MDRRSALKNTFLFMGGITLMPSCVFDSRTSTKTPNTHEKREGLVGELVDTFIPRTDIPGAKDLKVHHFVLTMVNDCLFEEEQQAYMNGLDQFYDYAIHHFDISFSNSSQLEREELLKKIKNSDSKSAGEFNLQEIKYCLARTKTFSIKGYMTSKYIMTEVIPYQLIPGHFHGCLAVDA